MWLLWISLGFIVGAFVGYCMCGFLVANKIDEMTDKNKSNQSND